MTETIRKEVAARKKARKAQRHAEQTRKARFEAIISRPVIILKGA